jgi:uncharacterized FlgJ-related protein
MRVLFLLLALLPVACSGRPKSQRITNDSLNVNSLRFTVYSLPFKYKDIVLAQAILETGWFTSDNCINNNNLFGMKRAYSRVTTSDTILNGYSHYPNWRSSVVDYFLLQAVTQDVNPSKSREEYYHYLDRTYSEVGRSYSSQVRDIIERLRKMYPDDYTLGGEAQIAYKPVHHKIKKRHRKA